MIPTRVPGSEASFPAGVPTLLERIEDPRDLKRLGRQDLRRLAAEIRERLVEQVAANGGHLASNLGVVELTLALHYVFDSPCDAIVWDIGHQAYVHKLLTGRRERFATLRKRGGLSGFCSRGESPHDAFGAGHAATSISAALGMAVARDLQGHPGRVIAVIGDGALTSGLAFEGLNNAVHLGMRLVVVLNDNGMSIAPSIGAVSRLLARLRISRRYIRTKGDVERGLAYFPFGPAILLGLRRIRRALRALLTPALIWEELGFGYVGPVDGHDLDELIATLRRASELERPVLVHVATTKGKGYPPAEADAVALHCVSPRVSHSPAISPSSGPTPLNKARLDEARPGRLQAPTYTKVFGDTLIELAQKEPRLVAITAAMPDGTGLTAFARAFPERYFDVGIAEAHAVTFAAGLATQGLRPVVAIYSTFLQRAYDSIAHDVCIQKLPVVFALDRAGLVGEDGRTHHGVFDLAYLRALPNLTVMAPRDEAELRRMLQLALELEGPVAIRYPRGVGVGVPLGRLSPGGRAGRIEVGRGELLREGRGQVDLALIALGSMVQPALEAAEMLGERGVEVAVVDARFVKPLDEKLISRVVERARRVVTVEEAGLTGGFGGAVAELLVDRGLSERVRLVRLGLPDEFVEHGGQAELRELLGLTPEGIARAVEAAFPELACARVYLNSSRSRVMSTSAATESSRGVVSPWNEST